MAAVKPPHDDCEGWDGCELSEAGELDGRLLGRELAELLGRLSDEGLTLDGLCSDSAELDSGLLGSLLGELSLDSLDSLDGLLSDELLSDDPDELSLDPPDELLSQGQHSPSVMTSHLLLSAKCLAIPHVPAGTKSDSSGQPQQQADDALVPPGPPGLPLLDFCAWQMSGQTTPNESWTVNVRLTGRQQPSFHSLSWATADPQRARSSSNTNRQWSSYGARICQRHS